ncbi:MAG TPA: DNA repair exonuclease [Polyangiaceae bacterium LLY-WYZ-15_(1-7)]|nr:hypothetical protein [Myxococcales bacterium]MAT28130.1 hypothetical protein [Sandaracinus sp.]HJL01009.1 DNA repair exonuclease [Polyangiaceae bacterium LLY-WYZ-15_(1-7)]MBJ71117.1 hypothetical protein [Sandaracinus sp.]HJL12149.1 DNA repair exonuclease [Polyangiaceae bacterium LLY-WYZ-15_(1-7)]
MAAKEEPVEDPVEEPVEELDAPAEGDALPPEDEVALTVLHTADWHLGRRFPAFDEDDARTLSRARLEVVERIFGVADRRRVDAVLCAGDLFDEPSPDAQFWEGLLAILERAARPERPIVLLPGNHDPLIAGSVWHPTHPLRQRLPEGVHVVDRDDFELALGEGAVLHARPCRSKAGQKDNALALPAREEGDARIRIGMVHGQTFDVPGCQQNFPIAEDAAVRRGFDYLAIGDTHAYRKVPPDAEVPTVYPSAPEATNFGEKDTGYVALVLFLRHRRRAVVRPERVARWTWRREKVTSLARLRELATEDLARTVLRLELSMPVSPEEYGEVEQLLAALKGSEAAHGRVGVLRVERDELQLVTEDIERYFERLPAVLRATVERLKAREAEQPEQARRALYQLYRLTRAAGGSGVGAAGDSDASAEDGA